MEDFCERCNVSFSSQDFVSIIYIFPYAPCHFMYLYNSLRNLHAGPFENAFAHWCGSWRGQLKMVRCNNADVGPTKMVKPDAVMWTHLQLTTVVHHSSYNCTSMFGGKDGNE